jgi:hypothetical protein
VELVSFAHLEPFSIKLKFPLLSANINILHERPFPFIVTIEEAQSLRKRGAQSLEWAQTVCSYCTCLGGSCLRVT